MGKSATKAAAILVAFFLLLPGAAAPDADANVAADAGTVAQQGCPAACPPCTPCPDIPPCPSCPPPPQCGLPSGGDQQQQQQTPATLPRPKAQPRPKQNIPFSANHQLDGCCVCGDCPGPAACPPQSCPTYAPCPDSDGGDGGSDNLAAILGAVAGLIAAIASLLGFLKWFCGSSDSDDHACHHDSHAVTITIELPPPSSSCS